MDWRPRKCSEEPPPSGVVVLAWFPESARGAGCWQAAVYDGTTDLKVIHRPHEQSYCGWWTDGGANAGTEFFEYATHWLPMPQGPFPPFNKEDVRTTSAVGGHERAYTLVHIPTGTTTRGRTGDSYEFVLSWLESQVPFGGTVDLNDVLENDGMAYSRIKPK